MWNLSNLAAAFCVFDFHWHILNLGSFNIKISCSCYVTCCIWACRLFRRGGGAAVHPFLFVYLPHAKISVKHSSTVTSAKPSTHVQACQLFYVRSNLRNVWREEGRKEECHPLDLTRLVVPAGPNTDRQEHTQKKSFNYLFCGSCEHLALRNISNCENSVFMSQKYKLKC